MSGQRATALPPANSWLVPAVVATLIIFPPTGVVAVIYAAQVRVRVDCDDLTGAYRAARRARWWTLTSFALFILAVTVMVASGGLMGLVDRLRE